MTNLKVITENRDNFTLHSVKRVSGYNCIGSERTLFRVVPTADIIIFFCVSQSVLKRFANQLPGGGKPSRTGRISLSMVKHLYKTRRRECAEAINHASNPFRHTALFTTLNIEKRIPPHTIVGHAS
jgi:hypothetical protein